VATNKVLVIDDSRVIRKTVRDMLPEGDFEVIEAKDGVEGMDLLTREHPSLIMLDFILPKLSGWDVFQQIQSNPEFQKIPLVLMSGKKEEVTDKMSEPFEFFEFIEKPFDKSILADAIRVAMAKSRKIRPQVAVDAPPIEGNVNIAVVAELQAQIAEIRNSMSGEIEQLQARINLLQDAQQNEVTAVSTISSEEVVSLRSQIQQLQQSVQAGSGADAGSANEIRELMLQIQSLQVARQSDKQVFANQIEEFLQAQADEREGFKNKMVELDSEIETLKKQLGQLVVLIKKKLM
jgi:CheY-like chemotaxis protein/predicted  nucleic acid-binding Zn-ribbon protein